MLPLCRILSLSLLIVVVAVTPGKGGDVIVKEVHVCCGACVEGVHDALQGLDGVSKTTADVNSKVVTYAARDEAAALKGIQALAKGGFFGTATHDKKPLAFPESGAKKGKKADHLTLYGVHLCCANCVRAAHSVLTDVSGVTTMDFDQSKNTVTLTGAEIEVTAAVAAFNKGGFFCTVSPKE